MKSQSLLPTKIDGRDILKTIKQSDPLDLAIWKLMSDGKKRTREDVATALREHGFRREDVDDRMATLYCSSNRRWFDAQGRNKNTTYQLRKNRLERPFARGGIEFESISNIRDILVIDEEAKKLFEEQDIQNQTTEETMSNANKPSAPPMPDDETATAAIDHSQLGAHNWFGGAASQPYSQSPKHSPSGAGMIAPEDAEKFSKPLENAPYFTSTDPRQAGGIDIVKRTLSANIDIPLPATQAEPTDFVQAGRDDHPLDPLLETTPNTEVPELEAAHPFLAEVKRLLGSHPAVKQDWFDRLRDRLAKQPERPMSVVSDALESLDITVNESFDVLAALGKIESNQAVSLVRAQGEVDILSNGMPAISTPASRALASSLMEKGAAATWADIGPDAAAKRVRETGLIVSDLGSQNFAVPLALQQAEEEGRLGEHVADQIFTDGPGAKFHIVRTYRKDDLETMILRIFFQANRVFAIRDLGDLLVGHPTTAIDYRVRKFLAAGLLKRIESGEGNDRRVHYHFNGDGCYTKPGQEVLDRMIGIAKEGVEHINSINVELGKYGEIPTFETLADSFAKGFDADRFIAALPRGRMDSGMEWFVRLVGIYGEDVGKVEEAMQALVDGEHLKCQQLTEARLAIKSWAREENKEEVVNTKPNRSHGEAELSSGAAILMAEGGAMSEEVVQALLTSGDGSELEQLIQNAKRRTEAQLSRDLHEALEAVFSDSDLIKRYFDDLVNSKDPAARKNTLVKLVTKIDPKSPVLELVKLANAASMAYEYFGTKNAGLDFALAATGAIPSPNGLPGWPETDFNVTTKSDGALSSLLSPDETPVVRVPVSSTPTIVIQGLALTVQEAHGLCDSAEFLSDMAKNPLLKDAVIKLHDMEFSPTALSDIGIELMTFMKP